VRRREFSSARAGWVGLGNLERKAHLYSVVRTSFLPKPSELSSRTVFFRRISAR
jgi:hypothetical protein